MSLKVKWFGALKDNSGYANSSRNYIRALLEYKEEIELSTGLVSFEQEKTRHELDSIISTLEKNDMGVKIQITHLTPENYPKFRNRNVGVYNIGYTAWETSHLPSDWVGLCNLMDEIWVPSTWNTSVFRNSGVSKMITCIPHVIKERTQQYQKLEQKNQDDFWFYSICQWTARKNPFCLLTAFFTEFWNTPNVYLALKTYRKNTTNEEKTIIKNDIENIKRILRLPKYPPILFYSNMMDTDELNSLHETGDCFVLPSKAEGWGIPFAEAMSFGKPTIGPRYSGNIDFMNDQNSFLVETHEEPVSGMTWMPHYTGTMTWGNPDVMDLRKKMRYVFENRVHAMQVGEVGRRTIREQYNPKVIGGLMVRRLYEVVKERGF